MIIITLYIFTLLIAATDYYIFSTRLKHCKTRTKITYSILSFFALFSLFIIQIINRFLHIDLLPIWLINTSVVIYFANAITKLIYATALWCSRRINRTTVFICFTLLWIIIIGAMVHGIIVTKKQIEIKQITLQFNNLPNGFDGFRIALFSDLHIGSYNNPQVMVDKLVDSLNQLNADIIIQCGDITSFSYEELLNDGIQSAMKKIKSKHGIYGVIGNHDLGIYASDTTKIPIAVNTKKIAEIQRNWGWHILQDSTEYLIQQEDTITITGLSFPIQGNANKNNHRQSLNNTNIDAAYNAISNNIFNITISHAPQLWENILNKQYGDLTLSGHVHSMQMKIRLGNCTWSPASILYKQWSGLYENNKKYIYVNDGIGCSLLPLRIGAPPEITLIELRKRK